MSSGPRPAVNYSLPAFKRARIVGHGGLITLVPSKGSDSASVLEASRQAAIAVSAHMEPLEKEEIWATLNRPVPTPEGPTARIQFCEPAVALEMVLDRYTLELESRGVSGQLKPSRTVELPAWENHQWNCLSAGFLLPADPTSTYDQASQSVTPGWYVAGEITRKIADGLLRWALAIEGETLVWIGATQLRVTSSDVADFVTETLPHNFMVSVFHPAGLGRARRITFDRNGMVSAQILDQARPRTELYEELLVLLRDIAPLCDSAFLREGALDMTPRYLLSSVQPKPPFYEASTSVREWAFSHLTSRYVYDAYVAQVLTDEHVKKLGALGKQWRSEDLGNQRHLVTHQEPSIWLNNHRQEIGKPERYEPVVPNDVVDRARTDFASIILRPELIAEDLPPIPSAFVPDLLATLLDVTD